MASENPNLQLLFSIVALQMDFIDRRQLVDAISVWLQDKKRPIEEILIEQGALSDHERQLLLPLIKKHVENHGGDAAKSLAAIKPVDSVADDLRTFSDGDLDTGISTLGSQWKTEALNQQTVASAGKQNLPDAPRGNGSRFRIVRHHAKGGLGDVWVAHDTELNREVALKKIQHEFADDDASRARFMLEAEVTGRLEHPGIVPVYSLGSYLGGQPFYAMRFIKGYSLREAVDRFHRGEIATHNRRNTTVAVDQSKASVGSMTSVADADRPAEYDSVEFRKLLARLIDVCNAIEYAHSRGVLHRDLKPGNIMLGKYGESLVVDWGLAKVVGRGEIDPDSDEPSLRPGLGGETAATQMGSAMGTPQYMSPEQAAGKLNQLGPASDVYSLGATLYYLLTGSSPFERKDLGELLNDVRSGEFKNPHELKPTVPAPLEVVCLRAMANQPQCRYRSARELADDIERYLADEPISEHIESWPQRARRWVRKHPALSTAISLSSLAAVVVVTGVFIAVSSFLTERAARDRIADVNDRLILANGTLKTTNSQLEEEREVVTQQNHQLGEQEEVLRETISELNQAQLELEDSNENLKQQAETLAQQKDQLEMQTTYVENQRNELQTKTDQLEKTSSSLATANDDLGRSNRELAAANTQLQTLELSSQYRRLQAEVGLTNDRIRNGDISYAIGKLDSIRVDESFPVSFKSWELHRLYRLCHTYVPSDNLGDVVAAIATSADGSVVAAATESGNVRIYDGRSAKLNETIVLPDSFEKHISSLSLTDEGNQLVIGTVGQTVNNLSVWDVQTRQLLQQMAGHSHGVRTVDISDDGLTMVTGGREASEPYRQMRVWERPDCDNPFTEVAGFVSNYPVAQVDLSGDGNRVVMSLGREFFMVWDRGRDSLIARCSHDAGDDDDDGMINCAMFDPTDPSGHRVLCGTSDNLVLDWNLNEILNEDRIVRINSDVARPIRGHSGPVRSIAITIDPTNRSSSGEALPKIVTGSDDESLIVWDPDTLRPVQYLRGHMDGITVCSMSDDGRFVHSGSRDAHIRSWHLPTLVDDLRLNSPIGGPQQIPADVLDVDFNHDNSMIVVGDENGRLSIWRSDANQRLLTTSIGHEPNWELQSHYLPESNRLITSPMLAPSNAGSTRIWDTKTGSLVTQISQRGPTVAFDVSTDGRTLLTYAGPTENGHRFVRTDVVSGISQSLTLKSGAGTLRCLKFSRNGNQLITGSYNWLRVWDIEDQELLWEFNRTHDTREIRLLPGTDSFIVCDVGKGMVRKFDLQPLTDDRRPSVFQTELNNVRVGDIRRVADKTLLLAFSNINPVGSAGEPSGFSSELALFDASSWPQYSNPDEGMIPEAVTRIQIEGDILSTALSRDGTMAYVTTNSGFAYDVDLDSNQVRPAELVDRFASRVPPLYRENGLDIRSIQVTGNDTFVLSGMGHVALWNLDEPREMFRLLPNPGCLSVRFHPTENSMLSVHKDGKIRLWRLSEDAVGVDSTMIRQLDGDFRHAVYSRDGASILAVDTTGRTSLLDGQSLEQLSTLDSPTEARINTVRFSSTDSLILAGTEDGRCLLWRRDRQGFRPVDVELPTHDGPVTTVTFGSDDNLIATGGEDGTVLISVSDDDWLTARLLRNLNEGRERINDVSINSSGDRVLVAQGRLGTLWHLDERHPDLIQPVFALPHMLSIDVARFSRDGRLIVSAAQNEGDCVVWLTDGWGLPKPSRAVDEPTLAE